MLIRVDKGFADYRVETAQWENGTRTTVEPNYRADTYCFCFLISSRIRREKNDEWVLKGGDGSKRQVWKSLRCLS